MALAAALDIARRVQAVHGGAHGIAPHPPPVGVNPYGGIPRPALAAALDVARVQLDASNERPYEGLDPMEGPGTRVGAVRRRAGPRGSRGRYGVTTARGRAWRGATRGDTAPLRRCSTAGASPAYHRAETATARHRPGVARRLIRSRLPASRIRRRPATQVLGGGPDAP